MSDIVIPARPTTYNGIKMRSRLEARFAAYLDGNGYPWEYEPRAFASQRGQYLPDFRMDRPGGVPSTYIEVRPHFDGMRAALSQMQIIWDSEPTALLQVTAPDLPFDWFAVGEGLRLWMVLPRRPWS